MIVQFTVGKDGALSDLKLIRGLFGDIDAEVLRVIKLGRKWDPGIKNGRPVKVSMVYPVKINSVR